MWPSIVLRGAQLIFAALIVTVLADAVSFARVPPVSVEPPREVVASRSELAPFQSFAVIEQRNVFRHKGGGDPPVAIAGTLPRSALDLELMGTLVAGEGRRWYSLAIVKDGHEQVMAVREGQSFLGGRIRVVSIEPRRMVIENAGVLEVVSLASEQREDLLQPEQPQKLLPAEIEARAGASSAASASDASVLEALRSAAKKR